MHKAFRLSVRLFFLLNCLFFVRSFCFFQRMITTSVPAQELCSKLYLGCFLVCIRQGFAGRCLGHIMMSRILLQCPVVKFQLSNYRLLQAHGILFLSWLCDYQSQAYHCQLYPRSSSQVGLWLVVELCIVGCAYLHQNKVLELEFLHYFVLQWY